MAASFFGKDEFVSACPQLCGILVEIRLYPDWFYADGHTDSAESPAADSHGLETHSKYFPASSYNKILLLL